MANTITLGRRTIAIVPDGSTDFNIATVQGNKFRMGSQSGAFTAGEAVTQATSGATGIVSRWDARQQILYLDSMTGTFNATNVVTGASSGAHGIPTEVSYAFPNGIRLSAVDFRASADTDKLVVREKTATGAAVGRTGGGFHRSIGGKSLRAYPYLVATEQVFTTPANVLITFEYD